jgi:uncharacterized protein
VIIRRAADHRVQPWANGRGQTVEMWREEGPQGLRLRLSVATVAEDGPFSLFPGIDRSLTVISGPGFGLTGAVDLDCRPMVPVAFPGDVAVRAAGVSQPSEDFNVMTARGLKSEVWPEAGEVAPGGRVFLLILTPGAVNDITVGARDLVAVTNARLRLDGVVGLAVRVGETPSRA